MNATLKQILIAAGMILFGAVVTYFVTQAKGRKEAKDATDKRITELERQLGIVGAQVAPFNTAFQSMLIKQLTHFHTPVMDALMVKLGDVGTPPTITADEEVQLIKALKQRAKDMGPEIDEDERDAAEMLPIQMRRVKRDADAIASGKVKLVDIQVVGRLDKKEE